MRSKILWSELAALLFILIWGFSTTPSFEQLQALAVGSDRVLLSRDGQVLDVVRVDFKKRRLGWFPLNDFSAEVPKAVIEAEDHRFNAHHGVDFIGLLRAANSMIQGHRVQGASTLTMQLTDLIQPAVLSSNQPIKKGSWMHKVVQVARALFLEARWSKDQILEAYLNLIHLRGEYQGIPALSFGYFNKSPKLLSTEEAVVATAMIASPNQSVTNLQKKSCALFLKISPGQTQCGALERLVAEAFGHPPAMPPVPELAPHLARRLVERDKTTPLIQTFVDRDLQIAVRDILQKHIQRLQEKNVHDAAAIVIDNASGEVLAYVGSVPTSESPYVDGVIAQRQAGSSLKPFIYARGLDMRAITAASILLDEGTAISWAGGVYRPTNYDRQFNGPVSVREALGSSLNVPAVKTLITVGLKNGYDTLKALHFTGMRDAEFYGVSMALGAVDIKLEELANAYRTLANAGTWSPLRYESTDKTTEEKIFSPAASFVVSSILSDANARTIGFGWDSPLETAFWTAVKTGTSKDYRDNWCAGFSDRYTVAVWDGNFNSEAMKEVSGVSGAAPSWFDIMSYLHRNHVSREPAPPPEIVVKSVRHEWVSNEHNEYFIKGTEPDDHVIQTAPDKRAQFVFPAEGSILVEDPLIDPEHIAVFVRFKGQLPKGAKLSLDQKVLGLAVSPFKISKLAAGQHHLSLSDATGELLTTIKFEVKE